MKAAVCDNCGLCVSVCPIGALESIEIRQQDCWDHAFGDKNGTWQIHCHRCRDICPYNLGSQNVEMRR